MQHRNAEWAQPESFIANKPKFDHEVPEPEEEEEEKEDKWGVSAAEPKIDNEKVEQEETKEKVEVIKAKTTYEEKENPKFKEVIYETLSG